MDKFAIAQVDNNRKNDNKYSEDHELHTTPIASLKEQTPTQKTESGPTNANETPSIKSNEKAKIVKGRKGDPRMHRAVGARIADPTISLFDALRAGGFNYPLDAKTKSSGMYNVVDDDGVQLGQRKNQLSRRLRQLSRKSDKSGT